MNIRHNTVTMFKRSCVNQDLPGITQHWIIPETDINFTGQLIHQCNVEAWIHPCMCLPVMTHQWSTLGTDKWLSVSSCQKRWESPFAETPCPTPDSNGCCRYLWWRWGEDDYHSHRVQFLRAGELVHWRRVLNISPWTAGMPQSKVYLVVKINQKSLFNVHTPNINC